MDNFPQNKKLKSSESYFIKLQKCVSDKKYNGILTYSAAIGHFKFDL